MKRSCDVINVNPGLRTEDVIQYQSQWSAIPRTFEDLQRVVNECVQPAREAALRAIAEAEAAAKVAADQAAAAQAAADQAAAEAAAAATSTTTTSTTTTIAGDSGPKAEEPAIKLESAEEVDSSDDDLQNGVVGAAAVGLGAWLLRVRRRRSRNQE